MACTYILIATSCQIKNSERIDQSAAVLPEATSQIFPKPKVQIKTIGIYLYDGYSSLDAMGPYSVFTHLMGCKIFFIAKRKGIIEDGSGLKVQIDTTIDQVKNLDVLLIPGGLQQTFRQTQDTVVINWVRAIDKSSKYTTSVCTGAWVLGAAGLLKNKQATTHWYGKKILAETYGAKVTSGRYTHTGKYWTAAGVSAGIDLSVALVNEIAGEQYTKSTMLDMEYDPEPPFKGGSENNTDKKLVERMRTIYDQGMQTALHPELVYKDLKFDDPKDLVCGMPVTAGIGDTTHNKNKIYGFCSAECKRIFVKDPKEYLLFN